MNATDPIQYPPTSRSDVKNELHGVTVEDPYRWLEEPSSSAEVRAWIDAQNALTERWLGASDVRARIRARLSELWNHERFGVPERRGDRYFYGHNSGLENQDPQYSQRSLDDEPQLLLDPNELSDDGTVALAARAVSHDGTRLAYALSSSGSDWMTWHVRDVETGNDLGDVIEWSKFSGAAWTHDGLGFFYSSYQPPAEGAELTGANYHQKLCYHRLGADPADDVLVYQRLDEKEWGYNCDVTEDGRYLIVHVWRGSHRPNQIFYRPLAEDGALDTTGGNDAMVELLTGFDAQYQFVGNDGSRFWFKTDRDAARSRIVEIDVADPQARLVERVAESEDTLVSANLIGGRLVLVYLHDACSRVCIVADIGAERARTVQIPLPGLGSVDCMTGRAHDPEAFFSYTSFTEPTAVYRLDVETGALTCHRAPSLGFDPGRYRTEQVFVTSVDGTQVPMFITCRADLARDGARPTYLYGYGGFNIPLTPGFSVAALTWMEMGGVYAVANLRGGGEYGADWYAAGTLGRKQNVFDDFIAAAEWLSANGYTNPKRLAIGGGSNGGLLVGACLVQRPDLFAAAVPVNGVLDMLRYHQWTIGWAWSSDYGTVDDPEMFDVLRGYSPVHNTKPGTRYPAVMIGTADHDDRVVPAHSFKFGAALQHAQAGDAPILLRIDTKAGHGAGKPTDKLIEEVTDRFGFLSIVLGGLAPPG